MSMHRLLILFICFFFVSLSAQEESSKFRDKLSIKANYFGDFIMHPGLALGGEYGLKENNWFKLHLDADVGGYHHRWNHNTMFLQPSIGARFTTPFGLCFDLHMGYGMMWTRPSGKVYSVEESTGNLTEKGRPTMYHLKPNMSILIGWQGKRKIFLPDPVTFNGKAPKEKTPWIIQTGLEIYGQTRFNQSVLPHIAFKLGIVYALKS